MEKTVSEAIVALREAASVIGKTTQHLWPEIVRAKVAAAMVDPVVGAIILAIGFVGFSRAVRAAWRSDWKAGGPVFATGALLVFCLVFLGSVGYALVTMAKFLASPEGATALSLMGK